MTASTRLRLANLLIVIGCLAGMAISFRAWVSVGTWGRSFPTVPIINGIQIGQFPWDVAHAFLAAALLAGTAIWQRSRLLKFAAITASILLVLGDQSRLQPWLYQYLMMLGVLAFCRPRSPGDERFSLGSLRLIVICIYIYSGLHKFNLSFVNESVPLMLKPLSDLFPEGLSITWMGWLMAGIETLLGVMLAWRRTRALGVIVALMMHLTILLLIGPLGINYNHVVWPWNLTMIALAWVLFWPRGSTVAPVRSMLSKARQAQGFFNAPIPAGPGALFARLMVIILAALVPIGGLLGWVDVYLSWGMYAGAPPLAAVRVSDDAIARLPDDVAAQVQDLRTTGKAIVIMDWSLTNLRVAYPEEHLYWAVARDLSRLAENSSDMTLILIHKPPRWSGQRGREEIPLAPAR